MPWERHLQPRRLRWTACGDGGGGSAQGGVDLVKSGTITTCTHLPDKPFQFEQGGKIVGFDVDMIDLVAKRLGVKQSIVDTPFEEGAASRRSTT